MGAGFGCECLCRELDSDDAPLNSNRQSSKYARKLQNGRLGQKSVLSPQSTARSELWSDRSSQRSSPLKWHSSPRFSESSSNAHTHHGVRSSILGARLLPDENTRLPVVEEIEAVEGKVIEEVFFRNNRRASIYKEEHTFRKFLEEASVDNPLERIIRLDSSTLLACGQYGFIFHSKTIKDGKEVAVKLLDMRFQHVAVKEWAEAHKVSSHENIVDYIDILVFKDKHRRIEQLLKAQQEDKLGMQQNRVDFPDEYFVLLQEFMNRGTIADWIEGQILLPGGMFKTARLVASALAYMHGCGVAHNDVQPDNILLGQDPCGLITVRLADLGIAGDSDDFSKDTAMYGISLFCMAAGERFSQCSGGSKTEHLIAKVGHIMDDIEDSPGDPLLLEACEELPSLLRRVWRGAPMEEVRDWPNIQGWRFFDGDFDVEGGLIAGDSEHPEGPGRRPSPDQLHKLSKIAANGYVKRASLENGCNSQRRVSLPTGSAVI